MKAKRSDLATFDGHLLDGLSFCRQVNDLVDDIRKAPDGSRDCDSGGAWKKLIEDLIPIARYVQARYRENLSEARLAPA